SGERDDCVALRGDVGNVVSEENFGAENDARRVVDALAKISSELLEHGGRCVLPSSAQYVRRRDNRRDAVGGRHLAERDSLIPIAWTVVHTGEAVVVDVDHCASSLSLARGAL